MRPFFLFCLLILHFSPAWAWQGIVEGVVDGDTLKIRHESGRIYDVRLYGVDSPELTQTRGIEARAASQKLVGGKVVDVQVINVDASGTTVAVVAINDQYSLQAFLVGSGMAWVYDGHCNLKLCAQWQSMESQAKSAGRGLWSDPHPVPPWTWREQRQAATRKAASQKPAVRKKKTVRRKKTVKKTPADISASQLENG